MARPVVYTALLGGYDRLLEQPDAHDVDFVCFTDDPTLRSETWDIRQVEPARSPPREARHLKTVPHRVLPDAEWTIWVDARLSIRSPDFVPTALETARASGVAAMAHYQRDCLYEEAREVWRKRFDREPRLIDQVRRYRAAEHPRHSGLVSTGVLARRTTDPAIQALGEAWWAEIDAGSARDQISLPYVLRNLGITPGIVDRNPYRNDLYVLHHHRVPRAYPSRWRQVTSDATFCVRTGLVRR